MIGTFCVFDLKISIKVTNMNAKITKAYNGHQVGQMIHSTPASIGRPV